MKRNILLLLASVLWLTACTLGAQPTPTATPIPAGAVETAIAQTIEARHPMELPTATEVEPADAPTEPPSGDGPTEIPTFTEIPTNTLEPTVEGVCDQATFIVDVTIPDGTTIEAGAGFTKTWRLQNTGTCTWTTDYDLQFWNGDQMGGPGVQALHHSVEPGHTIDISVNLTAPTAGGTYKGNWKLRNAGGDSFALPSGNPFYVQIQVDFASPSFTPTIHPTRTVTPTVYLPPAVRSDTLSPYAATTAFGNGTVHSGIMMTGDGSDDVGFQMVVGFDLSGLPSGAVVSNAVLKYGGRYIDGNPFEDLNWLDVYCGSYFPFTGPIGPTGTFVHRFNNASNLGSQLDTMTLQTVVSNGCGSGASRIQFLFAFNALAKLDGSNDWVSFPTMQLEVTYTVP